MAYLGTGPAASPADLVARRVAIRLWYRTYLHREVESEAVMDGWLASWVANGGDAVMAAILDGPEGFAAIVAERHSLGLP